MAGQQLHSARPQGLIQKAPKMGHSQKHLWAVRHLDKQSPALIPTSSAPRCLVLKLSQLYPKRNRLKALVLNY